jgi:hypothetical protein
MSRSSRVQTQAINAVEQLNSSINNMIVTMITTDQSLHCHRSSQIPPESACDASLLAFLNNSNLSDRNARDFVIKNHLRCHIFNLLYTHFFDGQFFSGVGSETLRETLDHMITLLMDGGKLPSFLLCNFNFS